MLYFSRAFDRTYRLIKGNQIRGIYLGESNLYSDGTFIPICKRAGRRPDGLRLDLRLGKTGTGRPRINNAMNATEFTRHLFLSCRPDDLNPRDNTINNCRILLPAEQPLRLKAYGYGLNKTWYDAIFAVEPGDIFTVVIGDTLQTCRKRRFYIVDVTNVYAINDCNTANDIYVQVLARLGQTRPFFDDELLEPWSWTDAMLRYRAGLTAPISCARYA